MVYIPWFVSVIIWYHHKDTDHSKEMWYRIFNFTVLFQHGRKIKSVFCRKTSDLIIITFWLLTWVTLCGAGATHFLPQSILSPDFQKKLKWQWRKAAKSIFIFTNWTKWQWQKVLKFALFSMPLFAILFNSTPDFQKWTKWLVTKMGSPSTITSSFTNSIIKCPVRPKHRLSFFCK